MKKFTFFVLLAAAAVALTFAAGRLPDYEAESETLISAADSSEFTAKEKTEQTASEASSAASSTASKADSTQASTESDAVFLPEFASPSRYYYDRLSENEKKAYDRILEKIITMPEKIRIPHLEREELNNVFTALRYDNPLLFFVGSKCKVSTAGFFSYFQADYTMSYEEYLAAVKEIEAKADSLLSSLTDPEDEWLCEYELHNAIINSCKYNSYSEHDSSVYGVLCLENASCEGYSKTMKYLLDRLGIEAYVLAGVATDVDGKSDLHMWNIVKINGEYSHLDVTWDDPSGDDDTLLYTYFNLTDSEICLDHSDWSFDFDCLSGQNNYYRVKGLYFDSFSEAEKDIIAATIAESLDSGNKSADFRFSSREAFSQANDRLFDGQEIYPLLKAAAQACSVPIKTNSVEYSSNDLFLIITVIPKPQEV